MAWRRVTRVSETGSESGSVETSAAEQLQGAEFGVHQLPAPVVPVPSHRGEAMRGPTVGPSQESPVPPPPQGVQEAFLALWSVVYRAGLVQAPVADEMRAEPVMPETQYPPAPIQPAVARMYETNMIPPGMLELVRQARQLGCTSFDGTGEASVAGRWIEIVTSVTKSIRLLSGGRVALAECLLEGAARAWWDRIRF